MIKWIKVIAESSLERFRYNAYLAENQRPPDDETANKFFDALIPPINSCSPNYSKLVSWNKPITDIFDTGSHRLWPPKMRRALNQEAISDLNFKIHDIDSGRTDLWGTFRIYNSARGCELLLLVTDVKPVDDKEENKHYIYCIDKFPFSLDYILKRAKTKNQELAIVQQWVEEASTGFELVLQKCIMIPPSEFDPTPSIALSSWARRPARPYNHGIH